MSHRIRLEHSETIPHGGGGANACRRASFRSLFRRLAVRSGRSFAPPGCRSRGGMSHYIWMRKPSRSARKSRSRLPGMTGCIARNCRRGVSRRRFISDPTQGLGKAHSAIRDWCAANGHRTSNICWEIYGHWEESWNADPLEDPHRCFSSARRFDVSVCGKNPTLLVHENSRRLTRSIEERECETLAERTRGEAIRPNQKNDLLENHTSDSRLSAAHFAFIYKRRANFLHSKGKTITGLLPSLENFDSERGQLGNDCLHP